MAKKHGKRSRGYQGNKSAKKSASNSYLVLGVGILTLGLLALGTVQVLGFGSGGESQQTTLQADTASLQSTTIEEGNHPGSIVKDSDKQAEAPVADRETLYLGPPSDPAGMTLAETGEVGQPTLVWFHADWCHVCQQIKPQVVDLGEQYDGQIKFVRLNIDYAETRAAVQRYGVRATPTFVLFDADGELRGNVPGWPGYQTFTTAFDQLLTEG